MLKVISAMIRTPIMTSNSVKPRSRLALSRIDIKRQLFGLLLSVGFPGQLEVHLKQSEKFLLLLVLLLQRNARGLQSHPGKHALEFLGGLVCHDSRSGLDF